MKFLIDMPLSPALSVWLTRQGHDAIHALDAGMDRAPDTAILQRAIDERRVIITADLDFPRLLAITQANGPGLILYRGGDYTEEEILDRLERVLEVVTTEELPYHIIVIEKKRIRRRRLPLN